MPIFRTAFTTPPSLSDLVATASLAESAIVLTWAPTTLDDTLFWRYRVHRQDPETGDWRLIGEVASKATPTFTDREAPHGTAIAYAVTVSNGWAESDRLEATAMLDLKYWIVVPGDASLVFEVRYVNDYRLNEEQPEERFTPLDRRAPLIVSGEELLPGGQLQVLVLPVDRPVVALLRRARRVDPWVLLKDPFGQVLRVRLGTIVRQFQPGGAQVLSVPFQAVA